MTPAEIWEMLKEQTKNCTKLEECLIIQRFFRQQYDAGVPAKERLDRCSEFHKWAIENSDYILNSEEFEPYTKKENRS